ncbi:MAG: hypothetical protein ACFFEN_12410 [Candidatus Thorarchaeota archaeon]
MVLILFTLSTLIFFGEMPNVVAAPDIYFEDFTTTTDKDPSPTSVSGWGTGSVFLPPRNPTLAGSISIPSTTMDVYVSGNYAYVTYMDSGMKIIDITNPNSPIEIGTCVVPRWGERVYVSGNYAYVTCDGNGLQVINIVDPSNPLIVGSWDTPHYTSDVFVSGNYAYVGDEMAGLQIVDISTPTNPTTAGSRDTPGRPDDIYVSGNYAYIADWNSHLMIIMDVSNPANPTIISSFDIGGYARGIYVVGNYAYIGQLSSNLLLVVDVSDPSNPIIVGSCSLQSLISIFAVGNYVYVGSVSVGFHVVNVEDPTNPIPEGTFGFADTGYGLHVVGNYAYVAAGNNDLLILELHENQFNPIATAQSLAVFTGLESEVLESATLSTSHSIPPNTGIDYYLSANNGQDWQSVILGVELLFNHTGNQLKWRAILTTSDYSITPEIFDITIEYKTNIRAPLLFSPLNATITNNATPTFRWESISGTLNYRFQLDTESSFDSPDLVNITVASTDYTPLTSLSDGTWYWRTAAIGSGGSLGTFSVSRTYIVDTLPPGSPTLLFPVDGSSISNDKPQFEWVDIIDAVNYTLYIDTSLSFNSPNLITVNTVSNNYTSVDSLIEGFWYWKVCAYDFVGNQGSFGGPNSFNIDTSPPNIPFLILPYGFTSDDTPTFTWSNVPDTDFYLLELDTSMSFSSPDHRIFTDITSTNYTLSMSLSESIWYWRVCAYDNADNYGPYSESKTLTIDATNPLIDRPQDLSFIEGRKGLNITWIASDLNPNFFTISRNDVIVKSGLWNGNPIFINLNGLSGGTYIFNCTIYDKAGNKVSDIVVITVKGQSSVSFGHIFIPVSIIGILSLIIMTIKKRATKLL